MVIWVPQAVLLLGATTFYLFPRDSNGSAVHDGLLLVEQGRSHLESSWELCLTLFSRLSSFRACFWK